MQKGVSLLDHRERFVTARGGTILPWIVLFLFVCTCSLKVIPLLPWQVPFDTPVFLYLDCSSGIPLHSIKSHLYVYMSVWPEFVSISEGGLLEATLQSRDNWVSVILPNAACMTDSNLSDLMKRCVTWSREVQMKYYLHEGILISFDLHNSHDACLVSRSTQNMPAKFRWPYSPVVNNEAEHQNTFNNKWSPPSFDILHSPVPMTCRPDQELVQRGQKTRQKHTHTHTHKEIRNTDEHLGSKEPSEDHKKNKWW